MNASRIVFRLGLVFALPILSPGLATIAQTTSTHEANLLAPGLRKLTGDDAERAKELNKAIEAALNADRCDEAVSQAEELLALRTLAQGPEHFETVDADWRLKTLRRLAPMPKEDRADYQFVNEIDGQMCNACPCPLGGECRSGYRSY